GCTLCARNCPANAIRGTVKQPHVIDNDLCVKCGACESRCKFKAIYKEGGKK
ncbi:MAG: 4Fe-4S binding protein, partial [Clostridia bacterium]|nr:4Fe-4S binding protein [Clostridia bacterium]